MKFGMWSASVLLMALTGCTTHQSEEDVGDAPGSWVNSGDDGPSSTGGSGVATTGGSGPVAGGATGTGGYSVGGTAGAGGESASCDQIVAGCYSQAYACCGQGVDEQCEVIAGSCASIICPDPYPYPLECHDYIIPVGDGANEIQAFELAVNTCSNLGLTATSAELLELGVFVTCCPDPSGGGMGTGGAGWGTGGAGWGTGGAMGGYAGDMGTGGYEAGSGGYGAGGVSPVIPGFCSGIGGEGGASTGGMGGEGGFATGGMPAD